MKMRTKRTVRQFLSLLAVVTILCQIPTGAITAAGDTLSATEDISLINTIPVVVNEETSLRNENSKHFLLSDGTYVAVAYDMPVHYEKGDNWVEIDNTLVPATLVGDSLTGTVVRDTELVSVAATRDLSASRDDAAYYENNQNDFVVQLPQKLTDDKPIVINNDGHSLRFFATDVEQTAEADVSQPKSKAEIQQLLNSHLATTTNQVKQAEIKNDFATSAHKIRSAVSYAEIQDNIDINYYVYGQTLKEDIVLHDVPTAISFSFRFATNGLRAVLQGDNSVLFYDDKNETVFVIDAPYMADFDEGYSRDIEVTLTATDTGYVYTLTPDRGWLTAQDRVYPVTLDPSIKSTQNTNYIQDSGVQQSNPSTNYYNLDRIYVGSGTNSTEGRMYFKLNQWPSATNLTAASITSAKLNLNYYPQSNWQTGNGITINVQRVTSSWTATGITWNNQPSVSSTLVTSKTLKDVRGKTEGADVYSVTAWVKAHYKNPSADYGIRLRPSAVQSSLNRVCYISSDYYADTSLRPIITINYNAYNLYFKQFYDDGYVDRYGSSSASDIAAYTQVVSNYFFKVFGIKVHSTVSTYSSPADKCEHKSTYNAPCTTKLSGRCLYDSNAYHCTNNALALDTKPSGINSIAKNTKVIKWTGHINCESCPVGGSQTSVGAVAGDDQVLIHWGNRLTSSTREKVSTCTIAHEIGHTLGCEGDDTGWCESNICIMKSDVDDSVKLSNLVNLNTDAYCVKCQNQIKNYADTYLK